MKTIFSIILFLILVLSVILFVNYVIQNIKTKSKIIKIKKEQTDKKEQITIINKDFVSEPKENKVLENTIELLKDNVLILMGAVDTDEVKIEYIKKELEQYKVQASSIELINYGSYYKVHLVLILKPNMTIAQAKRLQIQISKELKRMKKIKIRFVNIDLDVV